MMKKYNFLWLTSVLVCLFLLGTNAQAASKGHTLTLTCLDAATGEVIETVVISESDSKDGTYDVTNEVNSRDGYQFDHAVGDELAGDFAKDREIKAYYYQYAEIEDESVPMASDVSAKQEKTEKKTEENELQSLYFIFGGFVGGAAIFGAYHYLCKNNRA